MNSTVVSYLSQSNEFVAIVAWFTKLFGFDATSFVTFNLFGIVALILIGFAATVGGLGTYAERKISADMQMRQGPNRVGPYGILQFLADGVKLMLKEDIVPTQVDKFTFYIAPVLCLVGVFASLAVFPVSSDYILTDLNVGIFYLLGMTSLVGVGVFLGGYSSNSKWFCFNTAIRIPGAISTEPLLGSISPDNIFKKVDLPAPLAPITP